jgi:hypothetical protein
MSTTSRSEHTGGWALAALLGVCAASRAMPSAIAATATTGPTDRAQREKTY